MYINVVCALLGLVLCVFAVERTGIAHTVDTALMDLRYETARRPATGDVVLVDIDARSLAEVGVWPWPRRLHGELVRAAEEAGAARVAFDIDFSAASQFKDDTLFAQALAEAGIETFLAAFVQPDTAAGELRASLPMAPLLDASWPAAINVPIDSDGKVRRFPRSVLMGEERIASIPSILARQDDDEGEFAIDHAIRAETLPRVSYVDLLRGRVDPEALSGKSLIVGASAIELHDLFRIPSFGVVSGSTVIGLATETLLQDRTLVSWTPSWMVLTAVLAMGTCVVLRCSAARSLVVLAVGAILLEGGAVWVYVADALILRTAEIQFLLLGLALWSASREFDLRRILLWAARRETQNTLRLLERIVDDGFDAIVIVDEGGRIARCNEAARALLDLPPNADISDLPELLQGSARRCMAELAQGEERSNRFEGIHPLRTGSGDRFIEYAIASFWLDDPRLRFGTGQPLRYGGIMLRDVTDRERSQERLRFAALHDSLTGLANRRALEDELCAGSVLASTAGIALLAFDLDRFKGINDALGHATGDAVLQETARRAAASLPADALLFRIGGDEFTVVLRTKNTAVARQTAEALVGAIAAPFLVNGHRVSVGTSVGIAIDADGCQDASVLRRHADVALYAAKKATAERVVIFDPGMETIRLERLALESDLKQALAAGQFEVVYQPQVRLADAEWTGAEALVRWRHPERGFVSPVQFIPVAEEMGLIHEIGVSVLETACTDASHWPIPIKVAVNVSPLQLVAGDIVTAVRHALMVSGLDPKRLELEITESAFVNESERLTAIFNELLTLGVSFALDDFGTGYSSLGYLHKFPIAKIKIDRSFVTDASTSRHSMAVLRSVMALADGLAIRTIAEGIETQDQSELLKGLGCREGQGYLFSRPVPSSAVSQLLSQQNEPIPTPLPRRRMTAVA